ncbi:MAG: fluoride efflux transporter CrcB [Flammeovirgaceae bacterium]|nr:fluoride efflux transporter CrcB [Flammeovirgaceae bacterium]
MKEILLIFCGGGLGSLCRFFISKWLNPIFKLYPLGTLTTNFLSCIVLGLVAYVLLSKINPGDWLRPVFLIGFCGGFSTFSTFSNEILIMVREGNWQYGVFYILSSIIISILALLGGSYLGKLIFG